MSLVDRLATGDHPVLASRVISAQDLKACIDRGYVIIKFTDTEGGTELGVRLHDRRTVLGDADFGKGEGSVHLAGQLTLNSVRVTCVADIEIVTLRGSGHLEIVEQK